MTKTAQKLIEELEALPENEQEEYAESLLRDLRRRKQKKEREPEEEAGELYEPFQIMLDADLDLPSDYSETYEEHSPAPEVSERIEDVDVSDSNITFHLTDGRIVGVPLSWSWRLQEATPQERQNYEISPSGYGVHWPDVDEGLSARGALRGTPAPRPMD